MKTEITFIGHATLLIRDRGINILTDPIFGNGPRFAFFFRRSVKAGMGIDELPRIDVLLISHSHLDHYHTPSLKRLAKLYPDARVIVPPGYGKGARRKGFRNVKELDGRSWESAEVSRAGKKLKITAVKSNHPRNTNGYVIEGDSTLWFPGDTGYFDEVRVLPERFRLDLVMLPLMRHIPLLRRFTPHIDAVQGVRLVKELKPKYAMPIHWGFYPRSVNEKDKFVELMKKTGLGMKLLVLNNGESARI
ncbi:Beta-lactamase superfamily domain protein [Candidatus Norongarragalina meridionalis]|nr:Beta-lactamase superfamily domain protein [Candidatus Norongarragalina meridionalis]